jgi:hypothetical protein
MVTASFPSLYAGTGSGALSAGAGNLANELLLTTATIL